MDQLADTEADVGRAQPNPAVPASGRDLYVAVADAEADFSSAEAVEALGGELRDREGEEPFDLSAGLEEVAAWADAERQAIASVAEASAADDRFARRAVLAWAPLGLVSGAWLQWLSAPGNCHERAVLEVLSLYASDVDVGSPRGSRGDAYLDLLRQLRLADHASPPARLVHDKRVPDFAFALPAALLALSRRPDAFFDEILGADLCLRAVGLPPALTALQGQDLANPDWIALDPSRERGHEWPGGLTQARVAVESTRLQSTDGGKRLLSGFAWAHARLREAGESLLEHLERLDPAFEMAALLRMRAREGRVYHQTVELAGRSLASWLRQSQDDPWPLMAALGSSRLIRPGCSQQSALVTGLVGENGPMFRIFAPDDLGIIRRWIDSLESPDHGKAPVTTEPPSHVLPRGVTAVSGPAVGSAPTDLREAYHLLQHRGHDPVLSRWARAYVQGWLARARLGVKGEGRELPAVWPTEGLRPWLLDQHDKHAQSFEEDMDAEVPSRDRLIDSTVQTSALTLIDGSWIHGFTDYQHASTEVGRFLFDTYWDELGNGKPALNHPRIYRELLNEMGVELPPTASRDFACSPLLRERSFELPVYWLSIGSFPRTFMPEILGLNLAMELSGVGGSYRRARIHLKHWGYSTRFVDVHNTIDNVATGHSAWAADAVDTLVGATAETQGRAAQRVLWDRVRTGFVSLDPPASRRARLVQRRAQRRSARTREHR